MTSVYRQLYQRNNKDRVYILYVCVCVCTCGRGGGGGGGGGTSTLIHSI